MAGLSDADQDQLPVSRQHLGRADRPGPGPLSGPCPTVRNARHSGMAELLFQEPHVRGGFVSGTRSVHSAHEIEEHPPISEGRGLDNPSRYGVLRLNCMEAMIHLKSGHRQLPGATATKFKKIIETSEEVSFK